MTAIEHGTTGFARGQLRACAAAFTFLTRIPIGRVIAHRSEDLAASTVYFPLVGLVVAGACGLAFAAARALWPTTLAVIVAIAVTVRLTGAFHEDALADTFDGFGGGWTTAQVLAIMKDSRVGSYALVGVLLVLAAKIAALVTIAGLATPATVSGEASEVARALVAGHVLGRWSSVVLMRRLAYVRVEEHGAKPAAGTAFVGAVTFGRELAATSIAGVVVAGALGVRALLVAAVAIVVTWLAARYFTRRIGGITGDALGAANQFVELSVYLALAARPPGSWSGFS